MEELPEAFFEVHNNLPREGPGDNESTKKAYLMLPDLPKNPAILDVGCGPGMQTIQLAKLTRGEVYALDFHQPYLEQLIEKAREEKVAKKIELVKGSMFSIGFLNSSFNLIWSEGAIYIIGFEKALKEWKPLLKPKGYIVASHISWLKPNQPQELKQYWEKNYPAIKTVQENLESITNAGYQIVNHFVLPEKSWWNNYYTLIEAKLPDLRNKHKGDEEALSYLAIEELEMDMFRRYSDFYSYVFYIMQAST